MSFKFPRDQWVKTQITNSAWYRNQYSGDAWRDCVPVISLMNPVPLYPRGSDPWSHHPGENHEGEYRTLHPFAHPRRHSTWNVAICHEIPAPPCDRIPFHEAYLIQQKVLIFKNIGSRVLIYWGRVKHKCVNKLDIIGSDNGLSPVRCQAIIWTNAG